MVSPSDDDRIVWLAVETTGLGADDETIGLYLACGESSLEKRWQPKKKSVPQFLLDAGWQANCEKHNKEELAFWLSGKYWAGHFLRFHARRIQPLAEAKPTDVLDLNTLLIPLMLSGVIEGTSLKQFGNAITAKDRVTVSKALYDFAMEQVTG